MAVILMPSGSGSYPSSELIELSFKDKNASKWEDYGLAFRFGSGNSNTALTGLECSFSVTWRSQQVPPLMMIFLRIPKNYTNISILYYPPQGWTNDFCIIIQA